MAHFGAMAGGSPNILTRGWSNIREAGPRRLTLTALLLVAALLLARFSWALPATDSLERALFDLRSYQTAEKVLNDERILIVAYTDKTLINARKRSPLDRGLLARALRNIDTMGARAIGIDILFDQPQDEDQELIATLRAMNTPTLLGYAETATSDLDIGYDQEQFLRSFMASVEGPRVRRASVRLDKQFGVASLFRPCWAEPCLSPPARASARCRAIGGRSVTAFPHRSTGRSTPRSTSICSPIPRCARSWPPKSWGGTC